LSASAKALASRGFTLIFKTCMKFSENCKIFLKNSNNDIEYQVEKHSLGQHFFIVCFTGIFSKKLSRGGLNKNKNKIHFLVELTKTIKIKLKKGRHIFIFRKTYF